MVTHFLRISMKPKTKAGKETSAFDKTAPAKSQGPLLLLYCYGQGLYHIQIPDCV